MHHEGMGSLLPGLGAEPFPDLGSRPSNGNL